jgi:predicted RNA binding protein YcfA (HicA-like mRNA interferase family)
VAGKLPIVSGPRLVKALERDGWRTVRQRGSHVRLAHADKPLRITIPLHRELKRGTLEGILADAGVDIERLRRLL